MTEKLPDTISHCEHFGVISRFTKKTQKNLHIELLFTDIHPMFVLHTKDGILYELLDEDEKMRVYYKHVPNAFVFYERGIKQA